MRTFLLPEYFIDLSSDLRFRLSPDRGNVRMIHGDPRDAGIQSRDVYVHFVPPYPSNTQLHPTVNSQVFRILDSDEEVPDSWHVL